MSRKAKDIVDSAMSKLNTMSSKEVQKLSKEKGIVVPEEPKELKLYYEAVNAYYNTDTPIMSDEDFDGLKEFLLSNHLISDEQIGAELEEMPQGRVKKPHIIKMGSLLSYHTHGSISVEDIDFASQYFNASVLDDKLEATFKYDGLAFTARYKKTIIDEESGEYHHELDSALTRGNGYVGIDITDKLSPYLPKIINLPELKCKQLYFDNIELRGEIVMKLKTFREKYEKSETRQDGFANARNLCSGIILRDDDKDVKDLSLVLYKVAMCDYEEETNATLNILIPKESHFKLYDVLPKDYYHLVDTTRLTLPYHELPKAFEFFKEKREDFEYATDGVVICGNDSIEMHGKNYLNSIALKFEAPSSITKIVDIEWRMKSNGSYTPIAILEPIELAGTMVRRASLYSYDFLMRNKALPGAVIRIEKSGDIIPYVREVLTESVNESLSNEFLPDKLDLDCFEIKGAHLFSKSTQNIAIIKFMRGIPKLGIASLGGGYTYKLWEAGYASIWDIYEDVLASETFEEFKEKFEDKVFFYDKNFDKICIGLYNRLIGIEAAHLLFVCELDNVGITLCNEIAKTWYIKDYVSKKSNTKAFRNVIENIELKRRFERFDKFILKPTKIKEVTQTELINVCLTGSPKPNYKTKDEFLSEFKSLANSDIKQAKYLITDNLQSNSNKMQYARANDIKIITYSQAFETFSK